MFRRLKKVGLAIGFSIICTTNAAVFTDIAGREITIPDDKKIERILLGEGRFIQAIALLEGDKPLNRIIGWQGDFKKLDPQTYEVYKEKFPEIDKITLIGNSTPESISDEKVLSIQPDVAIFGISGHGPSQDSNLVKYLEESGVPVVFVDFRSYPLKNTIPSIRILGQALQREKEAKAYIDFYEAELKRVTDITNEIPQSEKTTVFIELKAGMGTSCCGTAGNGNMGDFIDLAGGINIAKELLPGTLGQVNLEKVIVADPEVYIASGSILPNKGLAGIPFGMKTTKEESRMGLVSAMGRKGIEHLTAIKNKRAFGIWHNYYNSPYNILAIQNFAKWLYPEKFVDLDVQDTLNRLHKEFLAVDPKGTYWIDLEDNQ